MITRILSTFLLACLLVALWTPATAEEKGSAEADANNPLANIKAFNIQNYYIPRLSELDDQNANTLWLRYAQPLGPFLMRASLPVSRVPSGLGATTSGLGDLNANFFYLLDTGDPAVSVGVGPQVTVPTASEPETGADKYQAGVSAVLFNAKSRFFQWGGLVNWQASIGGSDNEPDTNFLAIQPFYFFQLGKGWYVRGAPVFAFNLETDDYHVPLGLGIGRVVPHGTTVYNFFVEPQFTVLDRGAGQPELQLFMGVNLQFN